MFEECRDLIFSNVKESLVRQVQQSPFYALSVDEKDAMLVILVTFVGPQGIKTLAPLAYKNLSGLEAIDLFQAIRPTLEECGLAEENLIFFADGASVMGTRQPMSVRDDGNIWQQCCAAVANLL